MIKFGMFNSVNGDRKYKAGDFASYFATFIGNGIFVNPSDCLQIIGNLDAMSVTLRPGKAWINGYYLTNDDNYSLTLDKGDTSLNRIDRIVVRLDFIERKMLVAVKKGALSASPIAPALKRDADAYELALADVYVAKGALTVSQASITDTRLNKSLCGLMHGVVDQVDTTTIFNQYQSWFNNYSVTKADEFLTWQTNVTTALEAWIDEQEAGFLAWSAAEEALYYEWLKGRKDGFDSWFETIKEILDTNAAGNLQQRIDAHKDATLPHKFEDAADGKTYLYGLQRNAELDAAAFMYAENAEDVPNIINLPTYEQVDEIGTKVEDISNKVKETSGVTMGSDGSRYVAFFDDVNECYNAMDLDEVRSKRFYEGADKFLVSSKVPDFNIRNYSPSFVYLSPKLRIVYGTVNTSVGVNVLFYLIVDADTFEVLGGKIVDDVTYSSTIYMAHQPIHTAMNSKFIAILIYNGINGQCIGVIDRKTYSWQGYQRLRNDTLDTSIVGNLSITEDGVVAYLRAAALPTLFLYPLKLNAITGLPDGSIPEQYTTRIDAMTTGETSHACMTDGTDFYVTHRLQEGLFHHAKWTFNRGTKAFTKVWSFNQGVTMSPLPTATHQYVATLNNGKKVIVKYFGTAGNGYMCTMTTDGGAIYSNNVVMNTTPLIGDRQLYTDEQTAMIHGTQYRRWTLYELNMGTGGIIVTNFFVLAVQSNHATINIGSSRVLLNANSLVNKDGIFGRDGISGWRPLQRSYNLLNHVKVDDQ
ncbi:hypothetical protein [Viridibacillus arvi]|uniref:hypothetical protein n=1 Tax=Viridibacillus arvi TaxID=263475 RepID=UPI0034CE4A03